MPLSEEELKAAEKSLAAKRERAQQLRDEIAEVEAGVSRDAKAAELVVEHKQMDEEIARLERQKKLAEANSPLDAAVDRVVESTDQGQETSVTVPAQAPGLYDPPVSNETPPVGDEPDELDASDGDDNTNENQE